MKNNLSDKIQALNKNDDYDCLLMFSGGKDSSYLLYYLAHELNLRIVTITLSHDFLPQETRQNIDSFAKRFSKKHINVENNPLNHSGKHFLETWINKPEAGSLITLCTGCRLGLIKPIVEHAKLENLNVVISGVTPFEESNTKMNLVNYKGMKGKLFFFIGYLNLLLKNPSLLKSIKAIKNQMEEYYYQINKKNIYQKNGLTLLSPFYDHIKYDETKITNTLKALNWQKPVSTTNNSYWRSDCNMYAIRHYFYNQLAGYNEKQLYYEKLFENKIVTKEYMEKNTKKNFEKKEVLDLLRNLELSEKSMLKYERFITNFGDSDIPYPNCGSCQGLPT